MKQIPFLRRYRLDAIVGVLGRVMHAQQSSQVSASSHRLVNFIRDLARLVPFADEGLDFVGDPFADLGAESGVRFVEVRGVVLLRRTKSARVGDGSGVGTFCGMGEEGRTP